MNDNRSLKLAAFVTLAVVLVPAGYYYMTRTPGVAVVTPAAQTPAPPAAAVQPLDLGQAESYVRGRAKQLSQHPGLSVWLNTEDSIRRFIAAAALIGEGKSPRDSLAFLEPQKRFMVKKHKGGKLTIDPKSYQRYDVVGSIVESINADAAAAMIKEMDNVLSAAGMELDSRYKAFHQILVPCMKELLAAPVVLDDIEVKKDVSTYVMVDAKLEHLSDAQKHLIRMGPQNTLKIQAKLRELGRALGLMDDQLRSPK